MKLKSRAKLNSNCLNLWALILSRLFFSYSPPHHSPMQVLMLRQTDVHIPQSSFKAHILVCHPSALLQLLFSQLTLLTCILHCTFTASFFFFLLGIPSHHSLPSFPPHPHPSCLYLSKCQIHSQFHNSLASLKSNISFMECPRIFLPFL